MLPPSPHLSPLASLCHVTLRLAPTADIDDFTAERRDGLVVTAVGNDGRLAGVRARLCTRCRTWSGE